MWLALTNGVRLKWLLVLSSIAHFHLLSRSSANIERRASPLITAAPSAWAPEWTWVKLTWVQTAALKASRTCSLIQSCPSVPSLDQPTFCWHSGVWARIKGYHSKPLLFGMVCYAAISNWYIPSGLKSCQRVLSKSNQTFRWSNNPE